MRPMLILCLLIAACGNEKTRSPAFHSPLLRSAWDPLFPRPVPPAGQGHGASDETTGQTDETAGKADEAGPAHDPRAAAIQGARALLSTTEERSGYGAQDLERILARAIPGIEWRASQGLAALVETAERAGGFTTDGRPRPGDIVLFHNQVDANGNGEVDDWLTGCGVVIERDGGRFRAVVRTGHAPREIVVWPDGPAVRQLDGEVVNSFLRIPHRSDPDDTPYLAGTLYAGHIDVDDLADATSE
jgi:hypothetical protein